MFSKEIQAWIGVFALVLIGLLSGISGTIVYTNTRLAELRERSALAPKEWMLSVFQEKLSLSKQQLSDVSKVYDASEMNRALVSIKERPDFNSPNYEFLKTVMRGLRPAQQEELHKLLRERFRRSRYPAMVGLIEALDLQFTEVEQVELLLARQVTGDLKNEESLNKVYAILLRRSRESLKEVLSPEKVKRLDSYINDLENR